MPFSFVFFKQKTAYEMRISDWSSDVCSSDLFVVFSAYNASGYSYYHWITSDTLQPPSEHVLQIAVAGALGFGFYTIGDISRRSLQKGGVGLITVMFAATARYLVESGWVVLRSEEHTSELQSLMRISYA